MELALLWDARLDTGDVAPVLANGDLDEGLIPILELFQLPVEDGAPSELLCVAEFDTNGAVPGIATCELVEGSSPIVVLFAPSVEDVGKGVFEDDHVNVILGAPKKEEPVPAALSTDVIPFLEAPPVFTHVAEVFVEEDQMNVLFGTPVPIDGRSSITETLVTN